MKSSIVTWADDLTLTDIMCVCNLVSVVNATSADLILGQCRALKPKHFPMMEKAVASFIYKQDDLPLDSFDMQQLFDLIRENHPLHLATAAFGAAFSRIYNWHNVNNVNRLARDFYVRQDSDLRAICTSEAYRVNDGGLTVSYELLGELG